MPQGVLNERYLTGLTSRTLLKESKRIVKGMNRSLLHGGKKKKKKKNHQPEMEKKSNWRLTLPRSEKTMALYHQPPSRTNPLEFYHDWEGEKKGEDRRTAFSRG